MMLFSLTYLFKELSYESEAQDVDRNLWNVLIRKKFGIEMYDNYKHEWVYYIG